MTSPMRLTMIQPLRDASSANATAVSKEQSSSLAYSVRNSAGPRAPVR